MKRQILHVDMDAFFASVEQLDNPEYRGLPVIVGGTSARGVVSTCSYEARKLGVHSAMPLFQARKLCPKGIYVNGRMERYLEVSEQIMNIFKDSSPVVEQLSIDEAFLDFTGMDKLGNVEELARKLQKRITDEVGITASIGLAPNKYLAKLASDMDKPHGFVVIKEEGVAELLAPLSVRKIFGIGKKAEEKLQEFGITKIEHIAKTDLKILEKVFGINASMIRDLANGIDHRPVEPEDTTKSIGKEVTFSRDYTDYESLREVLLELSGQVGFRLRRQGLASDTVTVKVKYADFKSITRSVSSHSHFTWDEEIFNMADSTLKNINLKEGVRLLGVTVSNLSVFDETETLDFLENQKLRERNKTVDALKMKFGEKIIKRGVTKNNDKKF